MIGFAPPLPEFRNLNEYVNIVQYALKSELTDDEIILAAEARAAKVSTIAFADWLSATRGTMFLPASSPPLPPYPRLEKEFPLPEPDPGNREGDI